MIQSPSPAKRGINRSPGGIYSNIYPKMKVVMDDEPAAFNIGIKKRRPVYGVHGTYAAFLHRFADCGCHRHAARHIADKDQKSLRSGDQHCRSDADDTITCIARAHDTAV